MSDVLNTLLPAGTLVIGYALNGLSDKFREERADKRESASDGRKRENFRREIQRNTLLDLQLIFPKLVKNYWLHILMSTGHTRNEDASTHSLEVIQTTFENSLSEFLWLSERILDKDLRAEMLRFFGFMSANRDGAKNFPIENQELVSSYWSEHRAKLREIYTPASAMLGEHLRIELAY